MISTKNIILVAVFVFTILIGITSVYLIVNINLSKYVPLGYKTITIDGIDKYEEISSDVPIILVVEGIGNIIKIKDNTEVKKIKISGIDITIYLPLDCYPEIEDDGIDTKIIHISN